MENRGLGRLPHDIDPRAQLLLMGELVDDVEARAEIERHIRHDLPFILEVEPIEPAGLAAAIEDRKRLVGERRAILPDPQYARIGRESRTLALDEVPGAQRVLRRQAIEAVALRAGGDAAAVGIYRDAVEQQVADRVGCKIDAAEPAEGRDLEIEVLKLLLQGEDPVMGDLPLAFSEKARVEVAGAVDRQTEPRRLAGDVGDLQLGARGAEDRAQPSRRVDDARKVGKTAALVGAVV